MVYLAAFFAFGGMFVIGSMWLLNRPLNRHGFRMWQKVERAAVSHQFDPAQSAELHGGKRIGPGNFPRARLTLDGGWACLHGRPPIWIDRRKVEVVRTIRGWRSSGLRFDTADGSLDAVIFWCDAKAALATFEAFGWPVDATASAPSNRLVGW